MKRHGFLFEQAFSRENLYEAYLDSSRHKHKKRACFNFERRLARNLDALHTALHDGSYRPQPYYTFTVYEPKARKIYAPSFCDLVVQHAIYRVIYPIFNAGFIDQSFACRKGMGTHKAADYAQQALRQHCLGQGEVLRPGDLEILRPALDQARAAIDSALNGAAAAEQAA